jgi:glyoxylase-like metal-dependent hydrolase (beta-lactamase superfamily II)
VHHPPAPVQNWYETVPLGDGVTLIRERYIADWLRCNIWHVKGRDRDLLIDAGMGLRPLKVEVPQIAGRPAVAVASHCHFDHMGGLYQFDDRRGHRAEADIYAQPSLDSTAARPWIRAETFRASPYPGFRHEDFIVRPAPLTGYLDEGDVLDLGDRAFQVFHLPGHSPGSIALFEAATGILFAGDVVYDGALFDTVYHSDREVYKQSLRRLTELPVTLVHAGHWRSFGAERMGRIIAEYLAGGRRLGDPAAYVAAASAAV